MWTLAVACGGAAALLSGLLWLLSGLWRLRRGWVAVTVTGRSMEPTHYHGDRVLVRRVRLPAVRAGQVVVVAAAHSGWMIKRAIAVPGDPVPPGLTRCTGRSVPAGALVVLGDNASVSDDSRRLGYVNGELLLGVVVGALSTASRPQDSGRARGPAGSGCGAAAAAIFNRYGAG